MDWIRQQLLERGIKNSRILEAFRKVPRELFVPPHMRAFIENDTAIPIGYGQTTSQPYIIALMIQHLGLKGDEKVLEIGTGSGYQTAILSYLAKEVYSVEIIPELADDATKRIEKLGIKNVHIFVRDGINGLPEYSPYDAIVVSAYTTSIPSSLLEQLSPQGGRLVIPIGDPSIQHIYIIEKQGDKIKKKRSVPCLFVPLKEEGFKHE